jgi:hypothetical protein
MKIFAAVLVLTLAAGCAPSMTRVERGSNLLGDRLTLELDGAWNSIQLTGNPARIWTMEGLPIDQLLVYTGLSDGEAIHAPIRAGDEKSFVFRSGMQPDEIVGLFDGMLSRGGSNFKLTRLEPARFGGVPGFQFDYELVRKVDNVRLLGIGYVAVDRGALFALVYHAPRLAFFPRHATTVRKIAEQAAIKG